MLWIALPCSTEAKHGRNAAKVSHSYVCPHWRRSCASLFLSKKHLRRNSTYPTPKFNSSTRRQQIQIQPNCKKPRNPLRGVLSSPTPSNNSSTASTLQHLLCPCVRYYATKLYLCHILAATSIEKLHPIPLLLRKTKMGIAAFLNHSSPTCSPPELRWHDASA